MKKFVLITLISAAIGCAFISCDNGAYSASPDSGGGGSTSGACVCKDPMSARIAGTEWIAGSAGSLSTPTPLGNTLAITGSNSSYQVIVSVANYTGTKDYTANGAEASVALTDLSNNKMYSSTSGTVKFTGDATNYVGNFTGELKAQDGATLSVNGGYFNVAK
jgi:hypothetical protein